MEAWGLAGVVLVYERARGVCELHVYVLHVLCFTLLCFACRLAWRRNWNKVLLCEGEAR